MSNEEMVKEAVEEAKKAAEAEAKEQEAKGQEPEDTEATEEEAAGKETNSEDGEEPKKKKLFEKKNKKDKKRCMRNATYNAFSLSFYRSDSLFLYYQSIRTFFQKKINSVQVERT